MDGNGLIFKHRGAPAQVNAMHRVAVVGKKNNVLIIILLTCVMHYLLVKRLALARRSSGMALGNDMKSRSAIAS